MGEKEEEDDDDEREEMEEGEGEEEDEEDEDEEEKHNTVGLLILNVVCRYEGPSYGVTPVRRQGREILLGFDHCS